MFDLDSGKLLIIGIVALIVIGPKELPGVMRQVGNALGKVRRMAAEFQGQFMEAMRESELEELKKDVEKMSQTANFANFDPLAEVKTQLNEVGSQVPRRPRDPCGLDGLARIRRWRSRAAGGGSRAATLSHGAAASTAA